MILASLIHIKYVALVSYVSINLFAAWLCSSLSQAANAPALAFYWERWRDTAAPRGYSAFGEVWCDAGFFAVFCSSLHLGCSVVLCELYLHTCMERGHAKGLHVRKQHWDKREQSRCELRSALHVLRQTGSNRDLHGSGADSFLKYVRQWKKKEACARM